MRRTLETFMFSRLSILTALLSLVVAGPATVLADRVYEGSTVESDAGEVFFTGEVQITVARVKGAESQRFITYRRRDRRTGEFSGSGRTFQVTLSGTSYSGANTKDPSFVIEGSFSCPNGISGVATNPGCSGECNCVHRFSAQCVSGCEDATLLPPECQEEEEEEEEEEEFCATARSWINAAGGSLDDAENWKGEEVPGPQDIAVFNIDGVSDYDVDVTSNVTHDSLLVEDFIDLNLNGFTYTLDPCAELAVQVEGFLDIARNGALVARGHVSVRGSRATGARLLLLSGAQFKVEDGDLLVGPALNAASFEIIGGAELRTSGNTFIGNNGEIAVGQGATWTALGQCLIGVAGRGLLTVSDGGKFLVEDNVNVFVGGLFEQSGAPSDGQVVLTGAGTLWEAGSGGFLVVGDGLGFGSVTVQDGARVEAINTNASVAGKEDSNGEVTVKGTGSSWIGRSLNVGVGPGSTGFFDVLDGAVARIGEVTIAVNPRSVGQLQVKGANTQMSVFDKIQVGDSGSAELHISDGGAVSAPQASVSRTLLGEGLVTVTGLNSKWQVGTLNVGEGGTGEVQVTQGGRLSVNGELIIGDKGIGTLNVDSSGLVNSSSAVIAQAFITSRGTVNVGANGTWINTGLLAVGDILAGGRAVLNIDSSGSVITDTLIIGTFGRVNGNVVIVSGVAQFFINQLLPGSAPKPRFSQIAATPSKGLLRTQAANEPAPGLFVRRLIIEEGGELIADTITLGPGGEIGGGGAANLDIISEGIIDPGDEEDQTDEFTINGDLTLGDDSEVQVDIGGLIAGEEYDVLTVNGHCQLGGTLKINLVNGYLPNVGDRFEVLKYESREGEYDTIDSDGTGVYFTPELANGRLTLIAAAVDESGRLSPEELADLALMQNACAPGCGPMGLMPLGLTLLGICGLRAGVKRGAGGC